MGDCLLQPSRAPVLTHRSMSSAGLECRAHLPPSSPPSRSVSWAVTVFTDADGTSASRPVVLKVGIHSGPRLITAPGKQMPVLLEVDVVVRRKREKLDEVIRQRHLLEQVARFLRAALGVEELVADLGTDLLELVACQLADQLPRDRPSVLELGAVPHPLSVRFPRSRHPP